MLNPTLHQLSTKALLHKKNFATIALITVVLGATIAFFASGYAWFRDGIFPDTFYTAIIALMAAYPVFKERKRVINILESRG